MSRVNFFFSFFDTNPSRRLLPLREKNGGRLRGDRGVWDRGVMDRRTQGRVGARVWRQRAARRAADIDGPCWLRETLTLTLTLGYRAHRDPPTLNTVTRLDTFTGLDLLGNLPPSSLWLSGLAPENTDGCWVVFAVCVDKPTPVKAVAGEVPDGVGRDNLPSANG